MIAMKSESERFKRAIYISLTVHVLLFIFLLLSPHIRLPVRKKMIHYVNVFSMPGGGGGGGGTSESVNLKTPPQEEITETVVPTRQTLQDLTTPQKMEEQNASELRHPVDQPKRDKAPPEEKKAVIEKQTTPTTKKPEQSQASIQGSGSDTGLKIGVSGGEGSGEGIGSGFQSEMGMSNFPFPYYPPLITKRISNFWVKSGAINEELFTTVFFKIFRNGSIGDIKVIEQSGNRILDRSAIRAITLAEPFPPLPQGYSYEYLEIQLIFEHGK